MSKLIYLLESVETVVTNEGPVSIGVLKVKEDKKNSRFTTIKVGISPLLAWKIENEDYKGLLPGVEFIGHEFSSEVVNKSYEDCPFRLTKFYPSKKSNLSMNYELSIIYEDKPFKQELMDFFGNKVERLKSRRLPVSNWLSYREVEFNISKSECSPILLEKLRLIS